MAPNNTIKMVIKRICLAVATLILVSACDGFVEITDWTGEPSEMEFLATGEVSGTKAELAADNSIVWQTGDEISVMDCYNNSGNACFSLTDGAGSTSGTFKGVASQHKPCYFLVSPYLLSTRYSTTYERVYFDWDGDVQVAKPGNFNPYSALMAAYTTGGPVQFKNLLSYIKVTTTVPCTEIEIRANSQISASTLTIGFDLLNGGMPYIDEGAEPSSGNGNNVKLVGRNGAVIAPGTYLIGVMPQSTNGFSVYCRVSETGTQCFKSTDKKVTFARNNILNLGAIEVPDTEDWLGDGTSKYPYLLNSKKHLQLLDERLNGNDYAQYVDKYYRMASDIDCEGATIMLGGVHEFTGDFDGAGHKITNVRFGQYSYTGLGTHNVSYTCKALFPKVKNAEIHDLEVVYDNTDNVVYNCPNASQYVIFGGIAGYAASTSGNSVGFTNCKFKVNDPHNTEPDIQISGNQDVFFGGTVAYNGGNLWCIGCSCEANVLLLCDGNNNCAQHVIGGVAGKLQCECGFDSYAVFDRCRNKKYLGTWYAKNTTAASGGIIGYIYESAGTDDMTLQMTDCVNEGEIEASGVYYDAESYAGGIIGLHDSDGGDCGDPYIYNCLNKGKIEAFGEDAWGGGIIGWCYEGVFSNLTTIKCCCAIGDIIDANNLANDSLHTTRGSITGNDDGNIVNCRKDKGTTAETMNGLMSSIPTVRVPSLVQWTGTGSSLDLDF